MLLLGACGPGVDEEGASSDSTALRGETTAQGERSAEAQAYVDAFSASLNEGGNGGEVFPPDETECFARGIVDGIGVDKLDAAGLTPEAVSGGSEGDLDGLSEGDRKVVAESFTGCIDLEQFFIASVMVQSGAAEAPDDLQACFADVDWEVVDAEFAESIIDGDDELDEDGPAVRAMAPCFRLAAGGFEDGTTGD